MFGRCALRLRQCIPFARKRGVLSRRRAAGPGSLVARHGEVHAPCEAETGNETKRRSAKPADRHGVRGYKGARRKRLAHRNASRGRRRRAAKHVAYRSRADDVSALSDEQPGSYSQKARSWPLSGFLPTVFLEA